MRFSKLYFASFCIAAFLFIYVSAKETQSFPQTNQSTTRQFDIYGDVPFEREQEHLNNFAAALQDSPNQVGYIIVYGGRRGRFGEATARANRDYDYLVKERGIDADRIKFGEGGYREELTVELYVLPLNEDGEAEYPPVSATVKPTEVEIIDEKLLSLTVLRKTDNELLALATHKVEARYPPIAKAAHASGEVVVQVLVNEEGKVTLARILAGHPLLRQNSVQAAYGWTFAAAKTKFVGPLTFKFEFPMSKQ